MEQKKTRSGWPAALAAVSAILILWVHLIFVESRYLPVENRQAVEAEFDGQQQIPNVPGLHAESAVLMDGDSGRILYGKQADQVRPMASTTKIMTCILALENGNLSDICTVSRRASGQPKVHLGAAAGSQIRLNDLLYSLMLESHNDSAVAIAEHIAGSVEAFAEMMNQKARDLGCADTWFVTPNGLDASVTMEDGTVRAHSTTAADLARIMRYCIQESPVKESFLEITRTPSRQFQDVSGKFSFSCSNHNALLHMVEGAVSGKTGFTSGAGYSYVGAVEDEGRIFIIALLGCGWPPHKTYKWEDARSLLHYGADHFQYKNIYQTPELGELQVDGAVPGEETVKLVTRACGEEKYRFLLGEHEEVELVTELPAAVSAPVKAGEILGTLRYELDGEILCLEPVYAAEEIRKADVFYYLSYMKEKFFRILRKM